MRKRRFPIFAWFYVRREVETVRSAAIGGESGGCDSVSCPSLLRWAGLRHKLRLETFFSCVAECFQYI
ncbi:hypothetical protein [Brevibacillus invocatus]|uniref:hypothetical protein n=1 Tax=Brevibacillus invocatus TaxID=173959 RepID=UPI00203E74AD|nr:hypothetical protein [Brevibacillus invocatus]MCM3079748.1 hypothetical protein [Brevibacillus invocatus]MCM3429942.1 hypothetical protein [Brevibacillus invocatus]